MKKKYTYEKFIKSKICDLESIKKNSAKLKAKGKKIILCHGTFDLLHAGHFRHFQDSKSLGDVLVVSITADNFVNKGPNRPLFNQFIRAEMIASLSYVDYVVLIEDSSALPAIKNIKPNIYIKGIEYKKRKNDVTKKIIAEEREVRKSGGILKFTDNITFSSSNLINTNFLSYDAKLSQIIDMCKKMGFVYFQSLLDNIKKLNVMVIGDSIIDKYVYTETLGKSAKESILSTLKKNEETFCGGAIAAANNVSDFVNKVYLLTNHGNENPDDFQFIKKNLNHNVKLLSVGLKERPTTMKTRYIDSSYMRKMFEVYDMNDKPLGKAEEDKVLHLINKNINKVDLVILADFGHGFLNKRIYDRILSSKVFLAINAQTNSANKGFNLITKYPHADYICIDEPEFRLATQEKTIELEKLLANKKSLPKSKVLIVTAGKNGCFIKSNNKILEIPVFTKNVVDTIGAGDAFFVISSLFAYFKEDPIVIGLTGNISGALKVNIHGHSSNVKKNQFLKFIESIIK